MKRGKLSFFAVTALMISVISCDTIETKKTSSQELLAKDWKAISLTEVETYPVLLTCNPLEEEAARRKCFEEEVSSIFYQELAKHRIVVSQDLDETVMVDFVINRKGGYCIDTLKISETVLREIPKLPEWIHEAAKALPKAAPATKQGIPVKTRFKLPVKLEVE